MCKGTSAWLAVSVETLTQKSGEKWFGFQSVGTEFGSQGQFLPEEMEEINKKRKKNTNVYYAREYESNNPKMHDKVAYKEKLPDFNYLASKYESFKKLYVSFC